jgi:hypothetical protein
MNDPISKEPKFIEKYDLVTPMKIFIQEKLTKLSSETIGWLAIVCLHAATIPSLLALMTGLTDNPPPVDVVFMVWTALFLFLVRATIQKDSLNLITIGFGFMVQAIMMALIFFK